MADDVLFALGGTCGHARVAGLVRALQFVPHAPGPHSGTHWKRDPLARAHHRFPLMRASLPLILLLWSTPLPAQDISGDVRELQRLHRELLEAHRTRDVDRWMAVEAPEYVSANGGRVTFPEFSERRVQRSAYLGNTTFDVYRDLREPLVRVSEDGSLGWLIAEVEVAGNSSSASGESRSFHDVWAWVELYENVDGSWRLVGNASNRRPDLGNGMP